MAATRRWFAEWPDLPLVNCVPQLQQPCSLSSGGHASQQRHRKCAPSLEDELGITRGAMFYLKASGLGAWGLYAPSRWPFRLVASPCLTGSGCFLAVLLHRIDEPLERCWNSLHVSMC
jgi:hypothetical protein